MLVFGAFCEPLPDPRCQFRHQRRGFFGRGESKYLSRAGQYVVGLFLVFARDDLLAGQLSVRRFGEFVKRLFQTDLVEVENVGFMDGAVFGSKLSGVLKGDIVGFHFLVLP